MNNLARKQSLNESFNELEPLTILEKPILIVSQDDLFLRLSKRRFFEARFSNVAVIRDLDNSVCANESIPYELIVLDISPTVEKQDPIEMVRSMRSSGYKGWIVTVTSDASLEEFFCAAAAGANDYLIKGSYLDILFEAKRFFGKKRDNDNENASWCPETIGKMGIFRSLGLTDREIEILIEYARDFPRQRELARRIGKAENQLRKTFSRIYGKLESTLAVDNQAQLAHLLTTACAMYR